MVMRITFRGLYGFNFWGVIMVLIVVSKKIRNSLEAWWVLWCAVAIFFSSLRCHSFLFVGRSLLQVLEMSISRAPDWAWTFIGFWAGVEDAGAFILFLDLVQACHGIEEK